jgi:glycerate-2-kinase
MITQKSKEMCETLVTALYDLQGLSIKAVLCAMIPASIVQLEVSDIIEHLIKVMATQFLVEESPSSQLYIEHLEEYEHWIGKANKLTKSLKDAILMATEKDNGQKFIDANKLLLDDFKTYWGG